MRRRNALILLGAAFQAALRGWNCAQAADTIPVSAAWECVTPEAAFSPRDTAEGVVYEGRLWLSNGYFTGNVLSRDLWTSGDGKTWTCVNPETPYDGYSEMVVFRDRLWAVKGSAWSSRDGVTWDRVLEKTPFGARGYGELVVFQDRLWQLGSGADVWNSPDGVNWTCATDNAPYGHRIAAAVVVFRGALWLFGGYTHGESAPPEKQYPKFTTFNDAWRSDDGVHWVRATEQAAWAARMWFPALEFDKRLWILGGFDNRNGANLGDVWVSEDGVTWRELACDPVFSPRHEPTCYVYKSTLWLIAGNPWPVTNDVWRLAQTRFTVR